MMMKKVKVVQPHVVYKVKEEVEVYVVTIMMMLTWMFVLLMVVVVMMMLMRKKMRIVPMIYVV
jgi:hypothetical protein